MARAWMPDINLLVYAMRSKMAQHHWALGWLRERLEGGETVALHGSVLAGAIRISTRSGQNWEPTGLADAIGFLQSLVDHPASIELPTVDSNWSQLRRLCEKHDVTGSRVSDAFLSACAIDAECVFATADGGFIVYGGLTWLHLPSGQLRTNPT